MVACLINFIKRNEAEQKTLLTIKKTSISVDGDTRFSMPFFLS
ncbi:hypothetical protein HMPREF1048_0251 [Streptococcus mitis SK575]|uniref:Uncharacterized protein n=1 Tax=Streptococcus mitis SK575 TaxID=1095736 RepID=I0SVW8_STRMT|nr:hypothetical protein HMPREF1048_0251 [Streptococcus mitis SK575]